MNIDDDEAERKIAYTLARSPQRIELLRQRWIQITFDTQCDPLITHRNSEYTAISLSSIIQMFQLYAYIFIHS